MKKLNEWFKKLKANERFAGVVEIAKGEGGFSRFFAIILCFIFSMSKMLLGVLISYMGMNILFNIDLSSGQIVYKGFEGHDVPAGLVVIFCGTLVIIFSKFVFRSK